MFKQVKTKLTVIYTFSLICLLISFIGVLYLFISKEIDEKEIAQIESFFNKEKSDFIEEIGEEKHHGLEFEPNRTIFYYVYNPKGEFVYGEETIPDLFSWIEHNQYGSNGPNLTRGEWGDNHFLLLKKSLNEHGYVLLGLDITTEKHLIQRITWSLLFLTVLFSLLFAFLGYYFAGQAMKPIKNAFQKQEKFVSDASHELRTPLSIFYSSIDLLTREEKEHLSPYGLEVLKDAQSEAALMTSLINNLLFLARSDKDQLELNITRVNLSSLVTSIYTRFSRISPRQIRFVQYIDSRIYLSCDEVKIQQLLYILLDNAFRFTKKGNVTLSLKAEADKRIITVEDTGSGISAKDLPFIFDRFYRADLSRGKGGSGLGLSIAKVIVDAHGGKIAAGCRQGGGSVFTVIINEKK